MQRGETPEVREAKTAAVGRREDGPAFEGRVRCPVPPISFASRRDRASRSRCVQARSRALSAAARASIPAFFRFRVSAFPRMMAHHEQTRSDGNGRTNRTERMGRVLGRTQPGTLMTGLWHSYRKPVTVGLLK